MGAECSTRASRVHLDSIPRNSPPRSTQRSAQIDRSYYHGHSGSRNHSPLSYSMSVLSPYLDSPKKGRIAGIQVAYLNLWRRFLQTPLEIHLTVWSEVLMDRQRPFRHRNPRIRNDRLPVASVRERCLRLRSFAAQTQCSPGRIARRS